MALMTATRTSSVLRLENRTCGDLAVATRRGQGRDEFVASGSRLAFRSGLAKIGTSAVLMKHGPAPRPGRSRNFS